MSTLAARIGIDDDAGAARPDLQQPADPGELVRCGASAPASFRSAASAFRDVAHGRRARADRAPGRRPVRTGDPGIVRHMSGPRLRVLLFAGGPRFYMRQFSSLVTELSARGHEVHVAFQPTKGELPERGETARRDARFRAGAARVGRLALGRLARARARRPRPLRPPALRARAGAARAHDREDRRAAAEVGRVRAARAAGSRCASRGGSPPATGRGALGARDPPRRPARGGDPDEPGDRRVHPRAARPTSSLATPVVNRASTEVEFLKSARRARDSGRRSAWRAGTT